VTTEHSSPTVQQGSRLALAFIFITALLDSVGLGIIIPVLPQLIAELRGYHTITPAAMSEAARWGGWLAFVFAGMQFLCAPLIGNLSDRFGRRPVLIASLLALGLDYLVMGLAPTLAWIFVTRAISGIAGASYPTIGAYIADVTPPEKRGVNFGLIGAAFSLGFIVGPLAGGLLGQFGPRIPFFAAAGLSLANALFGLFVLKESLALANRRKFEWQRANPVGALHAMRRFPMILGLIAVIILTRLAHDANPVIFTYYVMLKFGWNSAMVGYAMMWIGATLALVYMVLIRVVMPKIGEPASVYVGLIGGAISFAGYAFATQGWQMFVWITVFALFGFAGPALNGIMSKLVGPTEQGELQGALACVGSLTSVAAPIILTQVFAFFTGPRAPVYFPGSAFFVGALSLLAAAAVFTRLRTRAPAAPAAAAAEPAE
jgi:DHA1 family tetracycline resistance protein-like MFS transporter